MSTNNSSTTNQKQPVFDVCQLQNKIANTPQAPICSVSGCVRSPDLDMSIVENGDVKKFKFCSYACIGKYFFKYQIPKTY
jgi:hypothetical protein